MTLSEELTLIHADMAQPKKCPTCSVTWAALPTGVCTYRQIPVVNPPEDAPLAVCFKCAPPDFGGVSQHRYEQQEQLDLEAERLEREEDARLARESRKQGEREAAEYAAGLYTDPISPSERRLR